MCDQINKTRAYYLRTARSRYVKWLKKLRETIKRKIIVYCHREEDAIEKETQNSKRRAYRHCKIHWICKTGWLDESIFFFHFLRIIH